MALRHAKVPLCCATPGFRAKTRAAERNNRPIGGTGEQRSANTAGAACGNSGLHLHYSARPTTAFAPGVGPGWYSAGGPASAPGGAARQGLAWHLACMPFRAGPRKDLVARAVLPRARALGLGIVWSTYQYSGSRRRLGSTGNSVSFLKVTLMDLG